MQHQIFEPSQDLKPFVKCYWTLESEKENTPERNTIVPDGCMKLIFHYGDPYKHHREDGSSQLLPRFFLIGQLTRPYEVEPMGVTGTFFVCFHPNGFLPFTTQPIKEMENEAISLEQLFGPIGKETAQQVLEVNSTVDRIRLIENFLLQRLTDAQNVDQIVVSTVETILSANGKISVADLSNQYNVNRRKLLRKYSSSIGLSPKQLSKTIRLQATLKTLLNNKKVKLTDLAYENDFYDQAHFIKDFKEFTGQTPREFYGDQLKMSMIFDRKE